jgi:hypothetical protein
MCTSYQLNDPSLVPFFSNLCFLPFLLSEFTGSYSVIDLLVVVDKIG